MCGVDIRAQASVQGCRITSSGSAVLVQTAGSVTLKNNLLGFSGCAGVCFIGDSAIMAMERNTFGFNGTWGVQRSERQRETDPNGDSLRKRNVFVFNSLESIL